MKHFLTLLLAASFLSGCTITAPYQKPAVNIPQRWASATSVNSGQQIPENWWTSYNSKTLDQLISTADTQNLDIRAGIERINQARALVKTSKAVQYPSVDLSAGGSETRTSISSGSSSSETTLNAGLNIAYDLDVFGGNAAAIRAQQAALSSTEYTQSTLRIVTKVNVTQTYFNLISTNDRIKIAEENLKNGRDILRIIQARYDNGLDSVLELSQQKVNVSSNEASLATLQKQARIYKDALALLLGEAPQNFTLATPSTLSTFTLPEISPEQPSVLLERRPDIRASEENLIAANANIDVARAAFFPSIGISASGSLLTSGLGDPATTALALAGSLTAPLFKGGALEGNLENATARQRELVEIYRKTVLTAFGEVEDALAAVEAATAREKSLKIAISEAKKAYEISRKRYEVGTIDFQTLLNTQTSLLTAQDSYATALTERLNASVDLIEALGGGWKA